jgi:flagellar basal-body rod modification protein FlgD
MASIGSVLNMAGNANPAASTTPGSSTSANSLGSESTFLQLMVTEIKNQDPTAPMDSATFLTQLAQFSQLEQVAGIRQDIENGTYVAPTAPASSTTPSSSSTPASAATPDGSTTPPSVASTGAQAISNAATTVANAIPGN